MTELSSKEARLVSGGVLPFMVATVAVDLGLIATMWLAQKVMRE